MVTIMIVDSEEYGRERVRTLLTDRGYHVVDARDAEQARALLDDYSPDLIVCDTMMPDTDGYVLARSIRANPTTTQVPIVLFGRPFLDDIAEMEAAATGCGPTRFLDKAAGPTALLHAVEELVTTPPPSPPAMREDMLVDCHDTVGDRLVSKVQRRQAWLEATLRLTVGLLVVKAKELALQSVAQEARQACAARLAAIEVVCGERFVAVEAADGPRARQAFGRVIPIEGAPLFMEVSHTGQAVVIGDARYDRLTVGSLLLGDEPLGPLMAVPMAIGERQLGVLVLGAEPGSTHFTTLDAQMAQTFAGHAALALEFDRTRRVAADGAERRGTSGGRHPMSWELHDNVTHRLFGIGMRLQTLAAQLDPTYGRIITSINGDLDEIVTLVRDAMYVQATAAMDSEKE